MNSPLISIVIPTKDRQYYCFEVIKHVLSLSLPNTQIVIQDNSQECKLRYMLENDSLIESLTYNYNPKELSFVDNFSEAIELCQGEYICMIGDDDSVLPNIVEVAKYAQTNNIDAVIPALFVYFWPSENPIKPNYKNGFLSMKRFPTPNYNDVNPLNSLKALIHKNFQDYQYLGVPRIYHGLVKRSSVDKVKTRAGEYFKGLTPDMFMSVSLCFTCNNVKSLSIPFTISGVCPKSGSSASATGKHTGDLKDAPHFKGHKTYEWSKNVPSIYTVETIWAETGLQALSAMGESEYITYYNPSSFILELGTKYPQFIDVLLEYGKSYGLTKINFKTARLMVLTNKLLRRVIRKIINTLNKHRIYNLDNVTSISQACDIVTKILKINN